ncbi:MAG TPA: Gfo/Idh/MocA family oxidoreductase [Phycisphaerae bacterium]|nr:Gfo/Idh/MocA family oxidoreductase [Phycisphaerae bacterium]
MRRLISRRAFSTRVAAAGVLAATARPGRGESSANEAIRLGIIGLGNRGDQLIDAFKPHKDARIVALCDVYQPYVEFAREKVGGSPFCADDYRRLLDRKDIDAIVIATPDHWHALQCVDACLADKDVYVEKPLSLVVSEGRRMVQVAQERKRVVQVGIHRRSLPVIAKAAELVRNGAIGKVSVCRTFHLTNEWPHGIGTPPDSDPPPGLDWNMWLGPAPKVPYNKNRCFYRFRWFRDYSGGQLTNIGTHFLDVIQWAIGQDAPRRVVALGSKSTIRDNREIPDTMEALWEYPDGTLAIFSQFNANTSPGNAKDSHIEFRGTEGTLFVTHGKIEIVPEVVRADEIPALDPTNRADNSRQSKATTQPACKTFTMSGQTDTSLHTRNFLDCVKSREACNCSPEIGHRSTTTTLLANVAYDRGRELLWDGQAERFTNDEEANKLLAYDYRTPWKLR